jgi:hypothetical protein
VSLYDIALFVHVLAAIALVGGTSWAHLSVHLLERSDTVGAARAHAGFLARLSKVSGPIAGLVLVAGLYLAFAGDWWGAGWPGVSLGMFALAGALATGVLDRRVVRLVDRLDVLGEGPLPADGARALIEPTVARVVPLLTAIDVAIVSMMTIKPGLAASLTVAAVALAAGGLLGVRSARRHDAPTAPAAPAAPAV